MPQARHIGIVGCSAEGAALCFRTICAESGEVMGAHNHPEVSLHIYPVSSYLPFLDKEDWKGVADLMLASTRKLAAMGAELAICPDNTIHQAFEHVSAASPIPWLHIAEVVADHAHRQGFKCLALLGTKYLVTGPVYPTALSKRGIRWRVPDEADRQMVNSVIFDELVPGRISDASREAFVKLIRKLAGEGCDAVVLGCTEIPLLIGESDSPLPVLDSTRLLARAALRASLENKSA
eukprot:Sspe_Gene.118446::Locus_111845_Transcript_2_2_Confidence_0.667_Length_777::g.118446::m.118446/K01779/racD; aspartate racemase